MTFFRKRARKVSDLSDAKRVPYSPAELPFREKFDFGHLAAVLQARRLQLEYGAPDIKRNGKG